MSLQDYEIISQIGSGTYSTVYKVHCKSQNKFFAMKEIKLDHLNQKEKNYAKTEVKIFKKIQHPNVIKFENSFSIGQNFYIIMELAKNGDLQEKIYEMEDQKKFFPPEKIWHYTFQILEGLQALHSNKIIHRDIKASNILLMENDIVKIGDFNVGTQIEDVFNFTKIGTPAMMSPEMWNGENYSYKADIWSLGCVVYQMAALRPPFLADNHAALFLKISKGKYEKLENNPGLDSFIAKLLKVKPESRPSSAEILMFEEFKCFKNEPQRVKFFSKNEGKNKANGQIALASNGFCKNNLLVKKNIHDFSPPQSVKKIIINKIAYSPISCQAKDKKSLTPRPFQNLYTKKCIDSKNLYRDYSSKSIYSQDIISYSTKNASVKKKKYSISIKDHEVYQRNSVSPYRCDSNTKFFKDTNEKNIKKSKIFAGKHKRLEIISNVNQSNIQKKKIRRAIGSMSSIYQNQDKQLMRISSAQKIGNINN